MRRLALMLCLLIAPVTASADEPSTRPATFARPPDRAVADGVAFLAGSQNPDGSWGSGTVSHGNEIVVSVPGSHQAFQSAVTALCVMALRESAEHGFGGRAAHDRGLAFLLAHPDAVRRGDPELLYNIWAHCYAVQALAEEASHDDAARRDPRLAAAVAAQLARMGEYESFEGGWNYYDFTVGGKAPAGGATSFGTAAGLVALWEAKRAGFAIPDPIVGRSIRKMEQMRLPTGGYLYGTEYKYLPGLPANLPRGNLGRTQAGNFALRLWGDKAVDADACRKGLDYFFAEHASIEAGRKRPMPHTAPYQTSGYYYYFDHYYAARLIDLLGPEAHAAYDRRLLDVVLPHQEADGSWWDYPMWDYHKPYGTAFAILTVLRCK